MPGVCEQHKSRKRGTCSNYHACKCCDPLETCETKSLGIAMQNSTPRNPRRTRTPHRSNPSSSIRRGVRSSELSGRKQEILTEEAVDEGDDIDLMHGDVCGILSGRGRNNKDILAHV